MKYLKHIVLTIAIMAGFAVALVPAQQVGAIDAFSACTPGDTTTVCKGKGESIYPIIQTVVNTLLFIIGVVAVIMVIIGGITYTTSGGDSAAVKKAKDTILYAIVGIVIAFLAYAVVNWVVTIFVK
jgi:uncharacterized membrane protein YjgN (DUF898 family)